MSHQSVYVEVKLEDRLRLLVLSSRIIYTSFLWLMAHFILGDLICSDHIYRWHQLVISGQLFSQKIIFDTQRRVCLIVIRLAGITCGRTPGKLQPRCSYCRADFTLPHPTTFQQLCQQSTVPFGHFWWHGTMSAVQIAFASSMKPYKQSSSFRLLKIETSNQKLQTK